MKLDELVYGEESYIITGVLFRVFNSLGPGHREKNYHNAVGKLLQDLEIPFVSERYSPLKVDGLLVGKYYLDFLVYDKIAIELKSKNHFYKRDIDQLFSYLVNNSLQLGILANFASQGVNTKRIINIH